MFAEPPPAAGTDTAFHDPFQNDTDGGNFNLGLPPLPDARDEEMQDQNPGQMQHQNQEQHNYDEGAQYLDALNDTNMNDMHMNMNMNMNMDENMNMNDNMNDNNDYNNNRNEAASISIAALETPPTPVNSSQQSQRPYDSPDDNDNHNNTPNPPAFASPINGTPGQYDMASTTAVDGDGMWRSWTRVFDQPRFACLDLLDNCLDATLHPNFEGRVVMKRLPPNGIVILNNSAKPIKPLDQVLVVYGSTKGVGANAKQDAIGENGVGLKHGCATLSDTSFVVTRNQNVYSVGMIAKALQTKQGVCLPSFTFEVEDADDKSPQEIQAAIQFHIQSIVGHNPMIQSVVQKDLGHDNYEAGVQKLVEHCLTMWNDEWGEHDYVFQVIITELIHSHLTQDSGATSSRSHNGNNPATLFLHEIKSLLPKFYVNIPLKGFEFWVENEKVLFQFWQHRLVEMTKFSVNVPKETPIQDIRHNDWAKEGYRLSIYCGFEAMRVEDEEQGSTAQMYIYSRQSGRLIQHDDDVRGALGLLASGSDFQQGLTIIIDDVNAQLPLMPTKQGIAWSEQKGGETHKRNLYAWAGAAAQCFWTHHTKLFQQKCQTTRYKTYLREAVESFCDPIRHHLHQIEQIARQTTMTGNSSNFVQLAGGRFGEVVRLELADFTYFRDIDWKREVTKHNRKLKIKKTFQRMLDVVEGKATLFKFSDENYPAPVATAPAPARQLKPVQRVVQQPVNPQFQHPQMMPVPTQNYHHHLHQQQQHNRHLVPGHHHHPRAMGAQERQMYPTQQQQQQPQQYHHHHQQQHSQPESVASSQNKRKFDQTFQNNGVGLRSDQPIELLDDDDDDDDDDDSNNQAKVAATPRREEGGPRRKTVARKSTGGARPGQMTNGVATSPLVGGSSSRGNEALRVQNMQRALKLCQVELLKQKDVLAEAQRSHQQEMRRLRQELEQAKKQPFEPPVAAAATDGNSQEVERMKEELNLIKREKKFVEKELNNLKRQRGTEVSELNLEIEGLKMKLEQQQETIKELRQGNGDTGGGGGGGADEDSSSSNDGGSPSRTNGYVSRSRMMRSRLSRGTDSI